MTMFCRTVKALCQQEQSLKAEELIPSAEDSDCWRASGAW